MTWRECLDGRGALDVVAVTGALRRAWRAGFMFDALLSEEPGLSLAELGDGRWPVEVRRA